MSVTAGSATVHPPSGGSITPPLNSGTGNGKATDRNGNQITVNGSVFTDTLGTTALTVSGSGTPASPLNFTYAAPNAQNASFVAHYTTYNIKTNFGCTSPGISEYTANGISLVSSITLPDNSLYSFTYEPTPGFSGYVTGRMLSLTLPTGGTITYTYTGGSSGHITCADGSASGLTRQTPDGTWTYARTAGTGAAYTTTLTDPTTPTANQTVVQFQGIYETQRKVYQGSTSGTLLQTTNTCYNGAASPCTATAVTLPITRRTEIIQLPDSSGKQSKHDLFLNTYGLPTEMDDYDYGTGAVGGLLKKTLITYASLANNINASQQTITTCNATGSSTSCNGTGTVVAQTTYNYDETTATATTGTPQHLAVSGSRGNLTTIRYLVQGTTYLTKTYSNYDTGNAQTATDFNGAQTAYTYGVCGNSFPTQVTVSHSPLSFSNSMTWDCNGAVLTSTTDTNNQTTNLTYDSMWRPITLKRPDNVQISYQYPSPSGWNFVVTTPVQGSSSFVGTTSLDGLGRPIQDKIADGSQTTYSIIQSQYDSLGRPYKVSNPFVSGTPSWTTVQFDALGRTISETTPDQAQTTWSYSGSSATATDAVGKKRQYNYDSLGRFVSVYEPDVTNNNALTVQTSYTYTALDQIATVTQGVQTRTYAYDLIGRLTSATTPEAGPVSFQFNSAGLVSQRTDARAVVTNYAYDALNRLMGKNYTIPQGSSVAAMSNVCDPAGGPTPTQNVCFFYDQGGAAAYALGRLTKVADPSGSEAYTFDQLGRTTQGQKIIGTTTYNTQYQYNLANELAAITYPSGRVVQQSYDAIGRLCAIGAALSTCSSGTTYATGLAYNPAGQLTGLNYGNGVVATFGYSADSLQLSSISYVKGAQTLLNLSYWYKQDPTNCVGGATGNNGQIQCVKDNTGTQEAGRSVAYTYDGLGRLSTAVTTGSTTYPKWGLSWAYDRYGNRLNQTQTFGNPPTNSLSFANPGGAQTNRPDNMCFDASGNLLTETPANPCPPTAPTYTYDAENRLANYMGTSATYTYDASGLRVKKVAGGTTTVYIFSGSKVIAEYDNGAAVGSPSREYVYSGSGLLAKFEGGATNYYHNDHLSARVLTDSTGAVIGQRGHYPFGETWYETGTTTKWKFTTYERDNESTNDYAMMRSFVSRFGRFLTPDLLSGSLDDPQSFNRYAYVSNDPCNRVDPLGLDTCILNLKIKNDANLTQAQLAAIVKRVNDILASTQSPNGDSVQVTTSFSGDADASIALANTPWYIPEGTYGTEGGLSGNNVYIDGVSGIQQSHPSVALTSLIGSVVAHEAIGHEFLGGRFRYGTLNGDQRWDKKDPEKRNIMMFDNAPGAAQVAAFAKPSDALWHFTPKQMAELYQKCIKKHPPAPKKKNGGGGGGGGNGDKDSGSWSSGGIDVQCWYDGENYHCTYAPGRGFGGGGGSGRLVR